MEWWWWYLVEMAIVDSTKRMLIQGCVMFTKNGQGLSDTECVSKSVRFLLPSHQAHHTGTSCLVSEISCTCMRKKERAVMSSPTPLQTMWFRSSFSNVWLDRPERLLMPLDCPQQSEQRQTHLLLSASCEDRLPVLWPIRCAAKSKSEDDVRAR